MKPYYTENAPTPIGPYSQAISHGNTLYISGQVALDPATGKMDDENIETETHRVMKNLEAVLKSAGLDFSQLIKCSIFILDMDQFATINEIYGSYFHANYPARETVEVKKLPAGARVEISAIAALP